MLMDLSNFYNTGVMLFKLTLGLVPPGRMVCGVIGLSMIAKQDRF